ncbi:ACT domain-containing protein [Limosilactobacillus mucosae]
MRAILTTIGKDKTGIIAGVSSYLAESGINIVDVSQTIMDGYFTMMMMVDVDDTTADFEKLTQELDALGTKLGVDINIRNQEMYDAMHQL